MPAVTSIFITLLLVGFSAPVLGMIGVEIAFVPIWDPTCRIVPWDFTRLEPTGCHSAVPEYEAFLGHVRLRTAYPYLEDIPDAIAIYDGDCTRSNATLVIFPYKLQFVDQEVHVTEEPEWSDIEYPENARYQVLKEGSLEWKKILGSKPSVPTKEGDVLYKKKDGQWGSLPNEIWVYPARQWGGSRGLKKTLDIYEKGVGLRPEPLVQPSRFENLNMRLGTLERQFPNSPDSVLARPRIGDDEDRLPGWLSNPQTRREWAGTEDNPLVPQQRKYPMKCGGQPIRYKDSLTEMTEQTDTFEKVSPGFRLFRNNRARSPLQIPPVKPGTIGSNKIRVPNPRLPKVQAPSGFSQSRSQSPDDFGWDVLRPQRGHQNQDPTPNYLGGRLRESAERDDTITEIPDELSPGEKIRVDMKETEYDPILAGLTSSAFRSDIRPLDSLSPILPLQHSLYWFIFKVKCAKSPKVGQLVFKSSAYDIAFTDDDTKYNGYDYNFAFLARTKGQETCNRLPIDLNIEKGPNEILVRARNGNTPVPNFIALYNNASPQLGECNHHSLRMILAFDPNVFDRQQLQKVRVKNIRYWKEIDYNSEDRPEGYESFLSYFRPLPGEFLMKDVTTLMWKHRGTNPRTLGWNEGPVLPNRRRDETVSIISEEEIEEEEIEEEEIEEEESDHPYTDSSTHLSSNNAETDGGAILSDLLLLTPEEDEPENIFDFWAPDTPPEIRNAIEELDIASIARPDQSWVSSIGGSRIPMGMRANRFENFMDSPDLDSIPGRGFLSNHRNIQQVENHQAFGMNEEQNKNVFYDLPYSEDFPEDIDITAFQQSPPDF
ncbi:hypothetical protein AOL_s00097g369 [Orbilia oligospora ATCC 24927]|uniref:Uncharacterized protein n=1 Tax=Arthrobotrys oligospora (strain ATCC 24927 / CBS 115.81 / DSM 1491) TaxID=756982 RepID=G1XJ42_ARTOA|nr:hypothetical protein AOL_s00097g369 [Orbilia oligospora ATCC 24927]EGX46943.1 hypothetical protein AOL_s00097g369 [Orbilia oligospora ATCC 24927]